MLIRTGPTSCVQSSRLSRWCKRADYRPSSPLSLSLSWLPCWLIKFVPRTSHSTVQYLRFRFVLGSDADNASQYDKW